MFLFLYADLSVMERRRAGQHLSQPKQAVAKQFQQGAGMRSVLSATGEKSYHR